MTQLARFCHVPSCTESSPHSTGTFEKTLASSDPQGLGQRLIFPSCNHSCGLHSCYRIIYGGSVAFFTRTTCPLISLVNSNVLTCWQEFSLKAFLLVTEEQIIIITYILYTSGVFLSDRKASKFTCSLGQERLT